MATTPTAVFFPQDQLSAPVEPSSRIYDAVEEIQSIRNEIIDEEKGMEAARASDEKLTIQVETAGEALGQCDE